MFSLFSSQQQQQQQQQNSSSLSSQPRPPPPPSAPAPAPAPAPMAQAFVTDVHNTVVSTSTSGISLTYSSLSLHRNLTSLTFLEGRKDVPPAVDLTQFLLQGVGQDALGATCNTQVLYRLLSSGRDIGNEIILLIGSIESPKVAFSAKVANFNAYNKQIGPLEEILLKLACLITGHHACHQEALHVSEIGHIIETYRSWSEERAIIREAWDALYAPPFTPRERDDFHYVWRYDDIACLQTVLADIRKHGTSSDRTTEVVTAILEIIAVYEELIVTIRNNTVFDEDVYDLSTRIAIIILVLLSQNIIDGALKHRVDSDVSIWIKVKLIIKEIVTYIQTGSTGGGVINIFKDIRIKWFTWETEVYGFLSERRLQDTLIITLIGLVGNVRRPYLSQAYVLVSKWQEFAARLPDLSHQEIVIIQAARDRAEATLLSARDAYKSIKEFSWEEIKATKTYSLFINAFDELKALYEKYHFKSEDIGLARDHARENDKRIVEALAHKYKTIRSQVDVFVQQKTLQIILKISEREPKITAKEERYTIDASGSLDAVLWALNSNNNLTVLKNNPRFFVPVDAQGKFELLDHCTRIDDLRSSDGKIKPLHLVVDSLKEFETWRTATTTFTAGSSSGSITNTTTVVGGSTVFPPTPISAPGSLIRDARVGVERQVSSVGEAVFRTASNSTYTTGK